MRSNVLALAAGALAVGFVASCDAPTRAPTTGNIAPRIELVRLDSTRASAALPPTSMRARAIGPTSAVIDLVRTGSVWTGVLGKLNAGTYVVIIEGLAGGQVQYYGRVAGVNVVRGETESPLILFGPAVPDVSAPALDNTTSFSQRLVLNSVTGASSYTVEYTWTPSLTDVPNFTDASSFVSPDTAPLIQVTRPGTWHVRTKAILPDILPNAVPWSDVRSWTVLEANGGNASSDPQPVAVTPTAVANVTGRNLTPDKRSDWHDFDVRAGDSLFVETTAARLVPDASPLNTVLNLFKANGTTQITTNNDFGSSTDSRIVFVMPETERVKLEVEAVGASSGHYELRVEIRRLPAAPTTLTALATSGTSANLTWVDNADNETGYEIERCTGAACADFALVTTTAADAGSYTETALTQGSEYRWRVRARNAVGTSAYTAVAAAAMVGPAAPTGLTATTIGNTQIDIAWTDNANNETGYAIERCTGAACDTFTALASLPADSARYRDLSVAFNTTYQYRVRALNNVVPSDYSEIGTANTIPPTTPTLLTATVMGPTRIDLSWSDNSSDETGFRIERCTGDACSNYAEIATVLADVEAYQDNSVATNTGYRYRVRAYNVVTGVDYTNVANADTRPPTVPTVLTATTASATSINLVWQDNSDDELSFSIQRCSSGATCTDFTQVGTAVANAEAFADNTATVGNSYRYQVVAIGVPGNSAPTNIASANTILPAAPTALSASTISATSIQLNWTDNANNETAWEISRCTGGACPTPTPLDTIPSGTTAYTDASVTPGVSYVYAVRAMNISGRSAPSNNDGANTLPPSAPTGFSATTVSGTQVNLAWTNTDASITGTRVERCTGEPCGTFGEIAFVTQPTATYSDVSAVQGTIYKYRVRAQNAADVSAYTAEVSATTELPAAPTGLTVTTVSATQIDLAWVASTGPGLVVGHVIERCDGPGCNSGFAVIDSLNAAATSYQNTGLSVESNFGYRVRAVNAVGRSVASAALAGSTRTPTAPTLLVATTASATSITLVWQDNSDDELSFSIQRCSSSAACTDFTQVGTAVANAEAFTDNTATVGNSYRYQVVAIGVPGNSLPTNVASANTILPTAPTALTATTLDATNIQLSWTDNSDNETSWEISRCAGAGCPTPTPLDTIPTGTITYTDATAVPGTSYVYAVRALNISGRSAPSNDASANTLSPSAPTGFSATTVSGTQVNLAWTNTDASITGTRVERCTGEPCGTFGEIAFVTQPTATYSDVSAVQGTIYKYRVRAQNAADVSAYTAEVSVTTELPAAPTGLTVTTVSATQIDLAWVASTGPGTVAGHVIERCDGPGCNSGFAVIDSLDAVATSYQNTGLTAEGDFGYRVRAVNAVGRSVASAAVAGNTRIPAVPTNVVATVLTGIVRLTWTDNADNEQGFVIVRCTLPGPTCASPPYPSVGPDVVQWDDSTAAPDVQYAYVVVAVNTAGSAEAAPVLANTLIADPVTVLSAGAVSTTQINLSWTASASQGTGLITGYNVYRCGGNCDPATGSVIATLASDALAYQDTSAEQNSLYTYAVVPITAFGETPVAGSATAVGSTALPGAPTNLIGTVLSPTSIQLAWTDNSDELGFEVAQCSGTGCTSLTTVATTGTDVASFLADTLTFSVRYRFLVRSFNSAGPSAWSDTLSIETTVPEVQTNVSTEVISDAVIRLSWTFDPARALTQTVERCEYVGVTPCTEVDFGPIDLHDASVRSADYGGHVPGTNYRFRLRSNNNAGSSAYSEIATITAGAPSAAPTGTLATTTGPSSIRITWSDQTNNETSFRIVRCTGDVCDPLVDGAEVGTVPRDGTLFDDTGVPTGELYRYAVAAVNGAGSLPSAAFAGHTRLPDAPGTLSATTLTDTEIALAWSDGGPFETGYEIERCEGGGCVTFAPIDTVPANFVSFNDFGLSPNATYRYQVRAINVVGPSAYSNIVERATDIPATPTGLTALAMTSTRIDLAWTDNATNEDFFVVERCTGLCDASGTFADLGAVLAPNTQAYSDNAVAAGLAYSYRVRAINAGGFSPTTNIASATAAAPLSPDSLAVVTLSGTLIALTWVDNATNELSYQVERCASAACPTFSLVRTLAASTIAYVDTVAVDDAYTYRVRAVNNVGPSGYTAEETANTIRPAAASNFTVTTVSATRIDLSWTDNATNEDGYVIERCSGDPCGAFAPIDSLPADVSTYQNDAIAPETSFTYRLFAYNIAGQSAAAGPFTATTITPAAPTGLTAVLAAPGQIDLTWTDNANNEIQYRVEQCIGGATSCATPVLMDANAFEVATLPPDANSHSAAGLAPSTLYYFRVRATNTAGSSAYSAIVNTSTSVPPAPSGLSASTVLATQVDLAWTDASANEAGFRIERCVGPDPCTSFTEIAQVPANAQAYVDNAAPAAEPFVSYRIIAFNGGGGTTSAISLVSTVVPGEPTDFVAAANGQSTINLTWSDNAGDEAGFVLERCTGLGCGDFAVVDSLAANLQTFADLTVSADSVYRYRLAAYGNGRSSFTPTADVATILPNAATDLVATAVSDTRVELTWTDNTATGLLWNETAFTIQRCDTASCTPTVILATVGRDTTFFVDSLLPAGVTFTYRVVALNLAGEAAASIEAAAATTVPAIPTSLGASAFSVTEVLLTWVDNANNETGYEIARCEGTNCTDFAPVDTAAADAQSIVIGGLVGGTVYRFQIRAINVSGSSGYSNAVRAQSAVPTAPTALAGAAVSPTQVNVSWVDNAENETAYIVERCDGTGCSGWAVIDSLAANTTSYQDTPTLTDTLYQYRVRASNIVGPSPYAVEIAVSTYRPQTPTGLVATPISATRIDLTWTDVAVNDTSIVVERCLGGGCTNFSDIASLPPGATSFSDSTVSVNSTYNYQLRAENASGASAPSAPAQAETNIPSNPSGLTATVNSATQITLDWVDNSNTEVDFLIERCEGAPCGAFSELFIAPLDVTTYQDATVTFGNAYEYRVIARAGGGSSGPSNVAAATTFPAGDVSALSSSPQSATTLQLTWVAAAPVTTYEIATVTGIDTTLFATVSGGVTDTLVTVPTGQVYNFVVRASRASGAGAYAGTFVAMTPPPAPDLAAFPLTTSQVTLQWTDTTARETGFEVQRSFFSGSFGAYTTVATIGANVTGVSDEVPAATGRYRYRVRAVNQIGAGAFSNEVDLTLSGPLAPSGVATAVTAPGQITLTWTDNSDNEQAFLVERSVGTNASYAQIAALGPAVQSYVDSSGIAINTTYYYRVRAINSIGPSGYSNESSTVTTVPGAVLAIGSEILSSTSIRLNWDAASTTGETGFRVYRCVGVSCVNFTLLDGTLPADAVTYTDVTAGYGAVFRYQVLPYNIAGEPTGSVTHQRVLVLPTPALDRVVPASRTSMRLAWGGLPFTWETGFQIQSCEGIDCTDFTPLAPVAANDTSYIASGLTANGTWHRYRVRAVADSNVGPWSAPSTSNTPRELTLGSNLVTTTPAEIGAGSFAVHYVVSMPGGSPTVEVSIGDDPGGTTVNNGSYLLVQRDKPLARHPDWVWGSGFGSDTLCSPPQFTPFDAPSVTCSLTQPNVATDYFIATYSYEYTNLRILALPGPTTYTINNCTQAGAVGPTQGQCDAAYTGSSLQSLVTVSDSGFQNLTVPFSGRWEVTAIGAAGVSAEPGRLGGRGARVSGEFVLTAGQDLRLAVGQMGSGDASFGNGGGGGGSFVFDLTGATPMLIAGGGGGTRGGAAQNGCDASTTVFAISGSGGTPTSPCTVKADGAGLGGIVSSDSWGSAGAGFNSNGADDPGLGTGGRSWAALLLGGTDLSFCGVVGNGGFGGGGAGGGCNGGGGGGGYSGGDGGWIAGGGGSFNAGTNTSAAAGVGAGHGMIILKYLGPVTP